MKTIVHVDQATIRRNTKTGSNDPALIVRTYRGSTRAHTIKINGPCEIKHRPHKPLSCGARVWIETSSKVEGE